MDHALTLHSDGTLTITLPKDAEVSRVVVNGASYRQVVGKLDCISKQAVLKALEWNWAGKAAIDAIKALPSAESEIIKCKDCKHQVKEWRDDKRFKDKGYWVYGCMAISDICGYWAWGGEYDEFCSEAERRTDERNDL